MNNQMSQTINSVMPMMVMVMTMGVVKPVMLQLGGQGRGIPKTDRERAATHFNVPVSKVEPWMIVEVEKIKRGTGFGRVRY